MVNAAVMLIALTALTGVLSYSAFKRTRTHGLALAFTTGLVLGISAFTLIASALDAFSLWFIAVASSVFLIAGTFLILAVSLAIFADARRPSQSVDKIDEPAPRTKVEA